MDAVILAGGKGTRIKKYLNKIPKPMIKVSKRDFLSYVVSRLCAHNINTVYILCGYRSIHIIKKYHNKIINFVPIVCVKEKKAMGTGGCLNKIYKRISKEFILVNGDTFVDYDYSNIIKKKIKENQSIMLIHKITNNIKSQKLNKLSIKNSFVNISNTGKYFNAGIYKFNKKIIRKIPKKFCSLEDEIIKIEIEKKRVLPLIHKGFFLDIGSPENLRKINLLPKILKRNAVFLDRDGTINEDYKYVYKKEKFHFRNGVIKGLKYLTSKNFYIFIVTNQAGIAKNKFTIGDFYKLQVWLKKYLLSKKITVHDVEYCPFHKNATNLKYKKNSLLRKPGNLMIENLKSKWDINLKNSFFIGDKKTDEVAAKKSGLKFHYIKKNFYLQIQNLIN